MRSNSKQLALKPQDLLVLFKMACHPNDGFTYAQLGDQLGIAPSATHSCVKRAVNARLLSSTEEGLQVIRPAFREFVLYGAKYSFPATVGALTRGVPTSYAALPLRALINQPDEMPPVWPSATGEVRGTALYPLYPTVPTAIMKDPQLYECLALFDALRIGSARERELAQKLLADRI
jgi:hypothetical protein